MQVLLLFLVSQVNLPKKHLTQYDLDTFPKTKYCHLQKFILADTCNQYQVNISAISIKTKWARIA